MRDPQRIDPLLTLLGDVWQRHPDMRLGQLLVNAIRPKAPVPEIFYAEDDRVLEGLQRIAEGLPGLPDAASNKSTGGT